MTNSMNEVGMKSAHLFSSAIGGFFEITKNESGYKVSFQGIRLSYFNIIIAVYSGDQWQLKFRFFTGAKQMFCTKFYDMHTLENGRLPEKFQLNTALVLGLKSNPIRIRVDMFGKEYGFVQ